MLTVAELRCEYLENPLGVGERRPRFSWLVKSDGQNVLQRSYQIQVSWGRDDFTNVVWDSGCVLSDQSVHVEYAGEELLSRQRYYYRVRITDNRGEESPWSEPAFFEMGLLDVKEWQAEFISADPPEGGEFSSAAPLFRKEFAVNGKLKAARVYVTSLGVYELHLNGQRVGEDFFTPGWTSYHHRLQYQVYDVTSFLQEGNNALGAMLGNGWYRGYLAGWVEKNREIYGKRTALLVQLHLVYADGRQEVIVSDQTWKTAPGPILMSEFYHGETYDARLEMAGWDCPGFDDSNWKLVYLADADKSVLIAQEGLPVRRTGTIEPREILRTPRGETVIDMGQNMVGWVKFRVQGPRGSRVVLKHAEVLDKDGNFYTENLRKAKQTIEYILKGSEDEYFEPHFTFQGFRYVKIEEFPGEPKLADFRGVVVHSDMAQTGSFACSDSMVNQLQHNILWGQKGNFVDVPTDCPQRDERLGWTGDAQVFARTACFNMDTARFFRKWLRDLAADQLENGGVPHVIPNLGRDGLGHSACGWADAAVICPWMVYLCYGDKRVLAEQYPSMKAWVEYIRSHSADGLIWNTGFHFGDWLALDAKEGSYFGATANDLTATAFYAYSTQLLARTAAILGKSEDARAYARLHQEIVGAFQKEFFTPNGRLAVPTQTAHVLALMFDLTPRQAIQRTIGTLVRYLEENKWHLTTGFLGTPYLCHVLSKYGRPDVAYKLLMQRDYPSWLYQVGKGATTIWEHWDGIKPDGSFWSPDMNSFNHYAYGSIGDWLYRVVAGINTDEEAPGYKRIVLRPQPHDELTWAEASLQSLYGLIHLKWARRENTFTVDCTIPANTTAALLLPQAGERTDIPNGLTATATQQGLLVELGSGSYSFTYELEASRGN